MFEPRDAVVKLCNQAAKLSLNGNFKDAFSKYKEGILLLQNSDFNSTKEVELELQPRNHLHLPINTNSTTWSVRMIKMSLTSPLLIQTAESYKLLHQRETITFDINDNIKDETLSAVLFYNMGLLLSANEDFHNGMEMFSFARDLILFHDDNNFNTGQNLLAAIPKEFYAALLYHLGATAYKVHGWCEASVKFLLDAIELSSLNKETIVLHAITCSGIGGLFLESGFSTEAEVVYSIAASAFNDISAGLHHLASSSVCCLDEHEREANKESNCDISCCVYPLHTTHAAEAA